MKWSIMPSLSQVRSASVAETVRLLVEAVDRHDREQLVDGPDVRRRLEDREVAVVDGGQIAIEVLELFGHELQAPERVVDLLAAVPVQASRPARARAARGSRT